MKKEFNLSEKDFEIPGPDGLYAGDMAYHEEDIKEFISRAKEILSNCISGGCNEELILSNFDKLAGDKLI